MLQMRISAVKEETVMKEEYTLCELEVIRFAAADVIVTSGKNESEEVVPFP